MVRITDCGSDLTGGFHTLNPNGQELHLCQRIALPQNPQHIVDRSAGGTGNNSNGAGVFRNGLFMGRIEQSLRGKFLLQLFKCGIQITHTVHRHIGAVQLVSAITGEDRNLTHSNDLHAIFRTETQAHGIALKHDTLQGSALILQREVMMTGGIQLVVADLATDGNLIQQLVAVHFSTDIFIDLRDRQHLLCHVIPPDSEM